MKGSAESEIGWNYSMKDDPLVEEIRRFRSAHAAKYGNDLDRIFAAIKEEEKKFTVRLVDRESIMQPDRNLPQTHA